MLTRRDLLKKSALLSLAPVIPEFLARTAEAAQAGRDERVLVVVQLDGGNDGLNTVVPFADEAYARHRNELRLPPDRILKLNERVGLHPAMRAGADLVEDARLAIVQGVGYPNPSRSHFRSMAVWQTASLDEERHDGFGWLGRALDGAESGAQAVAAIHVGREELPRPLRARRAIAASFAEASDLKLQISRTPVPSAQDGSDLSAFVRRSVANAYATAEQLAESSESGGGDSTDYPDTELARRLELVVRSLKSGAAARVYYVVQPGYDTHAVQLPGHARLLQEFSGAVAAFLGDLAAAGLADRVLLMAFSEFGRRVAENGSLGTDHGTAGPMFLAGPAVRPGLHGETPSLSDLDPGGDLEWSIDFRRVYATVLDDWLGLSSESVLSGRFAALPLLKEA